MGNRLVSVDESTYTLPTPVRTRLGVELQTPGSEVGAALLAVIPRSLTGTYAARPAATAVPAGTRYVASNVSEEYRSDGSVWSVVGSGGNELGYAQTTTMFTTTSSSGVDVTGLTSTFVVGERPIDIRFDGDMSNVTGGVAVVAYIVLDGVTKAAPNIDSPVAGKWHTISRGVRITGLTPGTTHTAKIQLATGTSGTARVNAGAGNPAAISVVTR